MGLVNAGSPGLSLCEHRASLPLFPKLVNRTSGPRFAPAEEGERDRKAERGPRLRGEAARPWNSRPTRPLIGGGGRRRGALGLFSCLKLSVFSAESAEAPWDLADRAPQTPLGRSGAAQGALPGLRRPRAASERRCGWEWAPRSDPGSAARG